MPYMDDDDYFDVAQICLNGHVVNDSSGTYPDRNETFCARCGAKTITACPKCKSDLRGFHHIRGVSHSDYDRPAFCSHCGSALPWTASALKAARELTDVLDGLKDEDREELKKSLNDLMKDTPRARVAETMFKQVMKRSGKEAVDAMRSVLTDVLSESVRKAIFGA